MRRLALLVIASLLFASLCRDAPAGEPPPAPPSHIDVQYISEPYVIDGGAALLVLSRNPPAGSSWATIDATTGKVIRKADIAQVELRGAAFSSDPAIALIWGRYPETTPKQVGSGAYLAAWDVKQAKLLNRFDTADVSIDAASITPDGTRALTGGGGSSGVLCLWDVRAGGKPRTVEVGREIARVAIAADGRRALLAGGAWEDENLYLWDLDINHEIRRFTGHRAKITHVAFWPDQDTILSASADGTIRLWDVESARELRRLRSPDAPVALIAPHTDGRRILAASDSPFGTYDPRKSIKPVRDVRVWDALGGVELGEARQYSQDLVECLGVAPRGDQAIGTFSDYTIRRWPLPAPPAPPVTDVTDASFARPLLPNEPDAQRFAMPAEDDIKRIGFLPNGVCFTLGEKNAVTRWDIERGVRIGVFVPPAEQHSRIGEPVDISADGRLAVSEHGSSGAIVWELASGLPLCEVSIHGDEEEDFVVVNRRLSGDGKLLCLGITRLDSAVHRLRFYHTSDGASAGKVELPGYSANVIALAPDGAHVAAADIERNMSVGIFNLDSGKLVKTLRLPKGVGGEGTGWMIAQLRFSADGSRVLAEPSERLVCWNWAEQKIVGDVPVPLDVGSVALSPDGTRALSGGDDSNVRLWDLATKKQIAIFDHPRGRPVVVFSPDGRSAIAGSNEHVLRVFRLPE